MNVAVQVVSPSVFDVFLFGSALGLFREFGSQTQQLVVSGHSRYAGHRPAQNYYTLVTSHCTTLLTVRYITFHNITRGDPTLGPTTSQNDNLAERSHWPRIRQFPGMLSCNIGGGCM